MKILMFGDSHFGIHNIEVEKWLNMMKDYFNNFFIEVVNSKLNIKEDKIFILGDLFDNKTYLNLKVLSYVIELFNKLEQIGIDIHIITGSHDYSSLDFLKKFTNITVYDKPKILNICDTKICMIPYTKSKQIEVIKLLKGKVKYIFTHSDLIEAKSNLKDKPLTDSLSIADFVEFKKVFSSRIHLRQQIDNFYYIGSPFHLDRSDRGDKKGLYILDIEKDTIEFIENNHSPEYKLFEIKNESDLDNIEQIIKNDYIDTSREDRIDLTIDNDLLLNSTFKKKIDKITKLIKFEKIHQVEKPKLKILEIDDELDESLTVTDLVRNYIKKQKCDSDINMNEMIEILEECIAGTKINK